MDDRTDYELDTGQSILSLRGDGDELRQSHLPLSPHRAPIVIVNWICGMGINTVATSDRVGEDDVSVFPPIHEVDDEDWPILPVGPTSSGANYRQRPVGYATSLASTGNTDRLDQFFSAYFNWLGGGNIIFTHQ